ncbi:MAG: LysE family transporter [Prevotellaceae bacterium]|jgi:threonine/homoserine/homoserine lactone efflux protein|nr:LysE family transporter [Prevotellaceae bacterium]
MIDIIRNGLIIGILTSVPVGPIAVLCIQRTLNRGKYHGFVTGLGAASSDLVYASLAAFSLSFIINFINSHQFVIEIVGAIIIFAFGMFLFRSNPVSRVNKNSIKKESYWQDFITSFALTITNPLIIFLFIGMFARFKFIDAARPQFTTAVGLLAVLAGAALWWFTITSFVSLFRSKINLRGLGLINKISGSILMGLSVIGLIYSILKETGVIINP